MRRTLDRLYAVSGALAAVFLFAICAIAVGQVGANIWNALTKYLTGESAGWVIPSYAEIGGFFLAAATFLALAYTLRHGGHIRVTLAIRHLSGRRRRITELWCVFLAGCFSAYATFYVIRLVVDSIEFGDVSVGIVPIPLYVPQLGLAIGLVVLTVALIDEYVSILRGHEPSYSAGGEGLMAE
jgi:TRAP-type C4-dicarboxylate transport system permease small subunit